MKNRKFLAALLSLTLIVAVAVPGTLGISIASAETPDGEGVFNILPAPGPLDVLTPTETEEKEPAEEPSESAEPTGTPATDVDTEPTETPAPEESEAPEETEAPGESETPAPEVSEAPEATEAPEQTETPAPSESAPADPEAPTEGQTGETVPSEGETVEGELPADPPAALAASPAVPEGSEADALYAELMACEELDAFQELVEAADEEILSQLTEEQLTRLEEKLAELEPEPLPEIVIGETTDVIVPSVIVEITPAYSYTNVAPLGDPVTSH